MTSSGSPAREDNPGALTMAFRRQLATTFHDEPSFGHTTDENACWQCEQAVTAFLNAQREARRG